MVGVDRHEGRWDRILEQPAARRAGRGRRLPGHRVLVHGVLDRRVLDRGGGRLVQPGAAAAGRGVAVAPRVVAGLVGRLRQGLGEGTGRGIAALGLLGHRLLDHGAHGVGGPVPQVGHGLAHHPPDNGHECVVAVQITEGGPPGDEGPQGGAQAVDVGCGRRHVAQKGFGSAEGRREGGTGGLGTTLLQQLGDAEVGDAGRSVRGQQDVGRLEVEVHHAAAVGGGHRVGHRHHVVDRLGPGDGAGLEAVLQGALHVVRHQQVRLAVVGEPGAVDGDDALVLREAAHGPALPVEAAHHVGVVAGVEDLERDHPVEVDLPGAVHPG